MSAGRWILSVTNCNGKRFRVLTLIDLCSRECLALHVDKSITGEAVAGVLDGLKESCGLPR